MEAFGLGQEIHRRLLVVDDEEINRELLAMILSDEYEIETAVDGFDALKKLDHDPNRFSCILLDILMPKLDGFGVLEELSKRSSCKNIPVIVLTSEVKLEVEALHHGALDFIKKPYESPDIVRARVSRIVSWYEESKIINQTMIDPRSGLFTRQFFRYFASQVVAEGNTHDVVALVLPTIQSLREFFGSNALENANLTLGQVLREEAEGQGGYATMDHTGTFFLCLRHRDDYEDFYAKLTQIFATLFPGVDVEIKLGVYPHDAEADGLEARASRAYQCALSIAGSAQKRIYVYDEEEHQKQIRQERLLHDFHASLEHGEFRVYFQPKYSLQGGTPRLAGAEALVRWFHKELGFVSPGDFVPLLEDHGLIRELDRFVYQEVGRVLHRLHEEVGVTVPVSANASRVEVFDVDFLPYLQGCLDRYGVQANEFHLEVTESAFADSSVNLERIVSEIRQRGYAVELDDFGAGYSALSQLTSMPFDYLKVDMSFTRKMFQSEEDTLLMKQIIALAKMLKKKTVIEGVETQEQVDKLVEFGGDYGQGYYFSKPLPEEEFVERVKKELRP